MWAMYGMTPEQLEEYGISFNGYAYGVDLTVPHLRYCPQCDCAQRALPLDPCWYCGGSTEFNRPAWWPVGGANEQVKNGMSFSPWELDFCEEIVALLLEGFPTGDVGDYGLIPMGVLDEGGRACIFGG